MLKEAELHQHWEALCGRSVGGQGPGGRSLCGWQAARGYPLALPAGRAWEDFVHREDELVTLVSLRVCVCVGKGAADTMRSPAGCAARLPAQPACAPPARCPPQVSGSMEFTIGGDRLVLEPGDEVFIPAGRPELYCYPCRPAAAAGPEGIFWGWWTERHTCCISLHGPCLKACGATSRRASSWSQVPLVHQRMVACR